MNVVLQMPLEKNAYNSFLLNCDFYSKSFLSLLCSRWKGINHQTECSLQDLSVFTPKVMILHALMSHTVKYTSKLQFIIKTSNSCEVIWVIFNLAISEI